MTEIESLQAKVAELGENIEENKRNFDLKLGMQFRDITLYKEKISEQQAEIEAKEVQRVSLMSALERQGNSAQEVINTLREQLAASQLSEKKLREALQVAWDFEPKDSPPCCDERIPKALTAPSSTEALDAYVADQIDQFNLGWKVEQKENINVAFDLQRQVNELTRQRDLAVAALATVKLKSISLADAQVTSLEALSAIKKRGPK